MAFAPVAMLGLTAISTVAGIAGAGVQAAGQLEQGQANANMANYQAQVAKNNAIIANQNADYAIAAGTSKAEAQSLKNAATEGRIKTAIAANGVDVNSGSAADVSTSEREKGELDTETVINNSQLEAYGYRSNSTSFTAQAGLDEAQASQAKTAGEIGAAGSLLSNASSLGFKWSGATSGGTWSADPGVAAFNSGAAVY